jgi:hypothetical protein
VTPDAGAQPGGLSPANGSGPREPLSYWSAQGRWVVMTVHCRPWKLAWQFRTSFTQISWICAAAFGCAASLAATLITGPRRPTRPPRPVLIQTPVPHLTCPVAFPRAPEQTRPDSSQASGRPFAADAPSPSRPG